MKESKKGLWNPAQYEKYKDERTRPFMDLMELLEPMPFKNAVDLGCGTGELTKLFHETFHPEQTLGIDASPEMLAKADTLKADHLFFEKSDIEKWIDINHYDVIISNAALQWCGNHDQIFQNLFSALKSGGQLAVQMPMNHDYPTHILASEMSYEKKWNDLLGGSAYDKYSALKTPEEYARLLYKLGFREQKVILNVYPHVLDSREGVVEWVKGSMLSYFKARLSENDYQNFLKEFEERLFKILPDEKPFFYPFKRILLWAKK